jgi:hypothetical protein
VFDRLGGPIVSRWTQPSAPGLQLWFRFQLVLTLLLLPLLLFGGYFPPSELYGADPVLSKSLAFIFRCKAALLLWFVWVFYAVAEPVRAEWRAATDHHSVFVLLRSMDVEGPSAKVFVSLIYILVGTFPVAVRVSHVGLAAFWGLAVLLVAGLHGWAVAVLRLDPAHSPPDGANLVVRSLAAVLSGPLVVFALFSFSFCFFRLMGAL